MGVEWWPVAASGGRRWSVVGTRQLVDGVVSGGGRVVGVGARAALRAGRQQRRELHLQHLPRLQRPRVGH